MPETKDGRGFAMLTVVLAMIVGLVSCDTGGPHLEAGEMADDDVYGQEDGKLVTAEVQEESIVIDEVVLSTNTFTAVTLAEGTNYIGQGLDYTYSGRITSMTNAIDWDSHVTSAWVMKIGPVTVFLDSGEIQIEEGAELSEVAMEFWEAVRKTGRRPRY